MRRESKYQLRRIGYGPDSPNYLVRRLLINVPVRIGRKKAKQADDHTIITVSSKIVSKQHCTITVRENGKIILTDYSSNGTYVNSEKCFQSECEIRTNDEIGLGTAVGAEYALVEDTVIFKLELVVKQEPKAPRDDEDLNTSDEIDR